MHYYYSAGNDQERSQLSGYATNFAVTSSLNMVARAVGCAASIMIVFMNSQLWA